MAIYRVTTVGDCQGQEIRMNFFYRLGIGIDASLLPFVGCQAIAEEFEQEVLPAILNCQTEQYTNQYIEADLLESTFNITLSMPYRHPTINRHGVAGGQSLGPASYVYLRANLEPMNIVEGIVAPKKGGVMFGPLAEAHFADGRLESQWWNNDQSQFNQLAVKLSQNLEGIDPPAIYWPVRVRIVRALGGLITFVGYSDVQRFTVDTRLKVLKSRQLER